MSPRPMFASLEPLARLVGVDLSGCCDECAGVARLSKEGPRVYVLHIEHASACPIGGRDARD